MMADIQHLWLACWHWHHWCWNIRSLGCRSIADEIDSEESVSQKRAHFSPTLCTLIKDLTCRALSFQEEEMRSNGGFTKCFGFGNYRRVTVPQVNQRTLWWLLGSGDTLISHIFQSTHFTLNPESHNKHNLEKGQVQFRHLLSSQICLVLKSTAVSCVTVRLWFLS